jgi:hypothetical protein
MRPDALLSLPYGAESGILIPTTTKGFTMNTEKGILTVGQMKAILANFSDEIQICVANEDWYLNIAKIELPELEDTTRFAITFVTSDDFDPRQN